MATKLRMRVMPRFLASIFAGTATAVRKDGLATYVDVDFSLLTQLVSFDPSAQQLLARSTVDGSYGIVSITQVITASQTEQDISTGDTVNVAATDGMIKIDKGTGSATTVNLPASNTKVGPVKIVDFKGDADTNPITVNCIGDDVFNGGETSWTISAAGGSIVATPLKDGTGYAI